MNWLTPLGGASEIGASCTLIEVFGARIVVDAGMRPSGRGERYPAFDVIERGGAPDAFLLTHAHNDHMGALPLFHRRFPEVPLFAVGVTSRLTRLILRDNVAIMERDFEGEVDFTEADVEAVGRAFVPVDYYEPVPVVAKDGVRVTATFIPAGHILGAAMLMLDAEALPGGRTERIFVSGDISFFDQPTLAGGDLEAVRNFRPTVALCEGTYGDKEHPDFSLEEARFVQRVAEVLRRGGRVVIPAFAIGRAQNVALILRNAQRNPDRIRRLLGDPSFQMPQTRVILDGMCRAVTDQYDMYRSLLHPALQRGVPGDTHVFYDADGILRPVRNGIERDFYAEQDEPLVMISSSGMLNGGPSVRYALSVAADPRSAILLCGYQDEESTGALLRNAQRRRGTEPLRVRIGGEEVVLRCEVDQYNLSAHSDARDIERLLAALRPERLELVHGTPGRLSRLRERLERFAAREGIDCSIGVAQIGERIEVEGTARFDAPVFGEAPLPPATWDRQVITGRAPMVSGEVATTTPWISAALSVGRESRLTGEEIARLQVGGSCADRLHPDDMALARERAAAMGENLWAEERVGAEQFFVPVGPGDGVSLVRAEHRVRSDLVRGLRGSRDLMRHWDRVRAMGVAPGDLMLFIEGGRSRLRLLPGLVLAETRMGFRTLSPTAIDPEVAVNQIVARVGVWPATVTPSSVPTAFDLHLLDEIRRALSVFVVERGMDRPVGSQRGPRIANPIARRSIAALRAMVEREALSPLGAAVGAVLLARWPGRATLAFEVPEVIELLGGEARASHAMVVTGLRDLVHGGIGQMRSVGRRIEFQWTARAVTEIVALPDVQVVFDYMGPVFETLLREAFSNAVAEIERLGLEGNENQGCWLAPPQVLSESGAESAGRRLKKSTGLVVAG
ncbi:MAG TPA: MBL fold metallo-hydrolase [Gemmatimonadaceae bacterium]